jgi:hypothetical protein
MTTTTEKRKRPRMRGESHKEVRPALDYTVTQFKSSK